MPSTPWTQTLACPKGQQASRVLWLLSLLPYGKVISTKLVVMMMGLEAAPRQPTVRPPTQPQPGPVLVLWAGAPGRLTVPRGRCVLTSVAAKRKSLRPRGAQLRVGVLPGAARL